jgi:LacI family transcriptional regulator
MATMTDVAKSANVSTATVSNVISGNKNVSPALEARVRDAIEQSGYEVNVTASSQKRTMNIGLIVSLLDTIFYPIAIRGVQKIAEEHKYNLLLFQTSLNIAKEYEYVKRMLSSRVDGIIIDSAAPDEDVDYFKYLRSLKVRGKRVPVVSIQRDLSSHGIPSVYLDPRHGGRIATEHLIGKGCKKIACVTGPLSTDWARGRLDGYKTALADAGIPFSVSYVSSADSSSAGGYLRTKQLLLNALDFDGLFAHNDLMAMGAMKALSEHDISIPDDIRIIGFDNAFLASVISPSLTTINVPKHRLGEECARMLLDLIEGKKISPDDSMLLPVNLIERNSTNGDARTEWEIYL